jgi:hypothetical protein
MLSYVLKSNEMSAATAFGLFGVFSMIRYRTEDITARDMTYLFIVMAQLIILKLISTMIVHH